MGALLALLSSTLWGVGDFLGGRATRTHGALVVLAWSQVAMLVLLWTVVGATGALGLVDVSPRAVAIGTLGGCAGVLGLVAFYRALAAGPMAVVPPIAAAGVALPVAVGLATGGTPSATVLLGLAAAVTGVVLAARGSGSVGRVAASTVGLCLLAALGFALVFVALDEAAGSRLGGAVVATAGVRLGSCAVLAVLVVARRSPVRSAPARDRVQFVGIGVLDTGANLAFAFAAVVGSLEVVAVLGSLYPAVTSAMAHVVLGERLGRVQFAGVALALVGVALLAAH